MGAVHDGNRSLRCVEEPIQEGSAEPQITRFARDDKGEVGGSWRAVAGGNVELPVRRFS
ncbi:MAG: hypothetical protein QOE55_4043 [Acidobacteriaceae bacterium]|nr:hypothetical protein [Acidobacteriaceae bacterium]